MSEVLMQMLEAIIEGNVDDIVGDGEALDGGSSPEEVLNQGLMAGMDHVGVEFRPAICLSRGAALGKAMQAAMDVLRRCWRRQASTHRQAAARHGEGRLARHRQKPCGHDARAPASRSPTSARISRLSSLWLRSEQQPDVVGMSALLTTTMQHDGSHHQGPGRGGSARSGQGDRWRRTGYAGICGPDQGRRLRAERSSRVGAGSQARRSMKLSEGDPT